MKRRTFIFLTAAGTASLFTGSCVDKADTLGHPAFLFQVSDAATVAKIGHAYRTQKPDEAQKDTLIGLLKTGTDPQHIEAEYAAGNTVIVKGWVLSLTEARQCALYSLRPQ